MIGLNKLIVLLFISVLFFYMTWVNFRVLNKYIHKKVVSSVVVIGLGMILVATFLDLISNITHIDLGNVTSIFFTIGIIIFSTYMILWTNSMVKVMSVLNKNANNDAMTGLYNRKGFEKVFRSKIASRRPFYIMVFDLDKTKIINDNFGHLNGDKYIISAAKIIKKNIGKKGFVARTGGDEFIALIENITEGEIEKIKASIKNSVSHIFYNQNTQVSIGYSKYKKDGLTFEELLNIADKKMYEEKKRRKENILSNHESII